MESQKKVSKKKDTAAVVRHIAELLKVAGGRALLVGGCVRDSLLGLNSKDFDMEVYGLSMETIRDILGKEFPNFTVKDTDGNFFSYRALADELQIPFVDASRDADPAEHIAAAVNG